MKEHSKLAIHFFWATLLTGAVTSAAVNDQYRNLYCSQQKAEQTNGNLSEQILSLPVEMEPLLPQVFGDPCR
ncbi:hypothetical protein [Thalassospira sp.]|uniref:hypothetical protein n=1 Tax=Thalassospira sp. TaxID=1912094 RepID=UPI0032EC3403